MISTILLVPSPEFHEALLSDGPCRARPPKMWRCQDVPWGVSTLMMGRFPTAAEGAEWALVLVFEGKTVWEGVFRAWSLTDDGSDPLMEALFESDLAEIIGGWRIDGKPLGRLVMLDSEGRSAGIVGSRSTRTRRAASSARAESSLSTSLFAALDAIEKEAKTLAHLGDRPGYAGRILGHVATARALVGDVLAKGMSDRTTFECRCCGVFVSGKTDGSFDEPGWGRIDGIDGPDAICPRCVKDPTALDGWRAEYPDARVREVPHG